MPKKFDEIGSNVCDKGQSQPQSGAPESNYPLGLDLCLTHKYQTKLKGVPRTKHSSFEETFVNYGR